MTILQALRYTYRVEVATGGEGCVVGMVKDLSLSELLVRREKKLSLIPDT